MPAQTLDHPPTLEDVHREVRAARAAVADLRVMVVVLVLVVVAVALDEPEAPAPEPMPTAPVRAVGWTVEPTAGPDPADCSACGSTAVYVVRDRPVRCVRCGARPAVTR